MRSDVKVRNIITDGLEILNEPVVTPEVIQKQAEKTVKEAMKYLWSQKRNVKLFYSENHASFLQFLKLGKCSHYVVTIMNKTRLRLLFHLLIIVVQKKRRDAYFILYK